MSRATTQIQWRAQWDYQEDAIAREATDIDFTGDPGKTLQAPAEEADINVIIKRFGVKDGSRLPKWQDQNSIYGDFSNFPTDPVEIAERLRQGDLAFKALPAELRNRFQSGPRLYNWLADPKNTEEAVTLGLFQKRPVAHTGTPVEPDTNT